MSLTDSQMREDVRPLCQRHLTPMSLGKAGMQVPPIAPFVLAMYGCDQPGCPSAYHMRHDYFDLFLGEPMRRDQETKSMCPIHGFPAFMYIAEYDPEKA